MFGWEIWRVQFSQHVLTRKKSNIFTHPSIKWAAIHPIPFLPFPLSRVYCVKPETKLNDILVLIYYMYISYKFACPCVDNHACILDEIITIQLPISSILKATRTILLWQFLLYLDFQILTELHCFSLKIIYFFLKIFIRFNKLSNLKCEFQ